MSLTEAWKKVQFTLASWGVYEPEGVRQDLMKQGWKFKEEVLPPTVCVASGMVTGPYTTTIVTSPEGKDTLTDDETRKQYNAAYQQAVNRSFNMS